MFFYISKMLPALFLFFFLALPLSSDLFLADYEKAHKALLRLWEKTYQTELKPRNILADPERKGILCVRGRRKKQICYYHFRFDLARPYRRKKNKEDKKSTQANRIILKSGRNIEAWLRCRANVRLGQCKLYFLRRDLLPGKPKYWRKI